MLMRAPTGFGKTVVASHVCANAVQKGRHVMFSTPRIELNRQAERTFVELPVQIACMQTIMRRDWPANLVVVDEAHHGLTDAWVEKLRWYLSQGAWVLGLTATPIPGMDRLFQTVVHGPEASWLMDNGHLSRYRAYGPSTPDLSGVPVHDGEYAKGAVAEAMDKPAIVGSAVAAWSRHAPGLRTVGYCVSRDHSRSVVAQFRAAGIRAEHIDGSMNDDERRAIIMRFATGETEWLGSVDLITLGFDMSAQAGMDCPIECVQDLAPTRRLHRHIQKLGRCLRPKPKPAIILDHAGNLNRLGFPDDEFEWSIATGVKHKRAEADIAVTICKSCWAAFRTAPACPYCQVERELTPREVKQIEGELEELQRREKRRQEGMAGRAEDPLAALAAIAKERGYSPGWLVHRMKTKGRKINYGQAVKAMQ